MASIKEVSVKSGVALADIQQAMDDHGFLDPWEASYFVYGLSCAVKVPDPISWAKSYARLLMRNPDHKTWRES